MSGISLKEYKFERGTPTLSKGDYFVIDPCYVFGADPFWDEFCSFLYPDDGSHDPIAIHSGGHVAFVFVTAHGDGVYPVYQDGESAGSACVDAGVLSFIPVEMLEENGILDLAESLGVRVTLNGIVNPTYDKGNVTCGNIKVITANEDDEGEYIWGSSPDDDGEDEWFSSPDDDEER